MRSDVVRFLGEEIQNHLACFSSVSRGRKAAATGFKIELIVLTSILGLCIVINWVGIILCFSCFNRALIKL